MKLALALLTLVAGAAAAAPRSPCTARRGDPTAHRPRPMRRKRRARSCSTSSSATSTRRPWSLADRTRTPRFCCPGDDTCRAHIHNVQVGYADGTIEELRGGRSPRRATRSSARRSRRAASTRPPPRTRKRRSAPRHDPHKRRGARHLPTRAPRPGESTAKNDALPLSTDPCWQRRPSRGANSPRWRRECADPERRRAPIHQTKFEARPCS